VFGGRRLPQQVRMYCFDQGFQRGHLFSAQQQEERRGALIQDRDQLALGRLQQPQGLVALVGGRHGTRSWPAAPPTR